MLSAYREGQLVLDGGLLLVDLPDDGHVELGLAAVGVNAVYLLLDVVELGVAEPTDLRVLEQGLGQALIPAKNSSGVLGALP